MPTFPSLLQRLALAACFLTAAVMVACQTTAPEDEQEDDDVVASRGGSGGMGASAGSGGRGGQPTAGAGGTPSGSTGGASQMDAAAPGSGGQPADAALPVDVDMRKDAGTTPSRSPGCGKTAMGTGNWVTVMVTIRNVARPVRVFVPRTYSSARAYPLIFVLHGAGGSGSSGDIAEFAQTSGEDAILLAPSGIGGRWDLSAGGVDVELMDKLRSQFADSHCIDNGRVFSYGFSMGGAMSSAYACARPGVLRAFGSQRGTLGAADSSTCKATAAWLSNSAMDQAVPPARYQALHDTFVRLNGCAPTSKPTANPPCVRRDGCSAGHETVECADTGDHNPKTGFALPAVWSFFRSVQAPTP